MKKHSKEWYVKMIQRCLNGIALCGPDDGAAVKRLHHKAKRLVERLKEDYPELEHQHPEQGVSRRGAAAPDADA